MCAEFSPDDETTPLNLTLLESDDCSTVTKLDENNQIRITWLQKLLALQCKPNIDCEFIDTLLFIITTADEGRIFDLIFKNKSQSDISYEVEDNPNNEHIDKD